jgi:hypothetical protein
MMTVNDARVAISNAMQRVRDLEEAAAAIRDRQAANRAGLLQLSIEAGPALRRILR